MARKLSFLLLLGLFGLAAAFFRPAVPYQVPSTADNIPRGGEIEREAAFIDAGLDNPFIESDNGIEASRKCGFCMGVSFFVSLFSIFDFEYGEHLYSWFFLVCHFFANHLSEPGRQTALSAAFKVLTQFVAKHRIKKIKIS